MKKCYKARSVLLATVFVFAVFVSFLFVRTYASEIVVTPRGDAPSLYISVPSPYLTVGYSTTISVSSYGITSDINYSSSDPSCATVDSSGVVTAVSKGTTTITGSYTTGGENLSSSFTITVVDHIGLESGNNYHLLNVSTGKCLQKVGSSLSSANWGGLVTAWTVTVQSNGTAIISSSSYALTAATGGFSLSANTGSQRQQLALYRVDSGEKAGCYLMHYGQSGYLYMAADGSLRVSTTLTDACYWSFSYAYYGSAEIFGFNYPYVDKYGVNRQYNSTESFEKFETVFESNTYYSMSTENPSSESVFYALNSADVFIYHGHGNKSALWFETDNKEVVGIIAANSITYTTYPNRYYIDTLPKNALSQARCILYVGCQTGANNSPNKGGRNLVEDTFAKGAHFVVGMKNIMNHGTNSRWLEGFLDAIGALDSSVLTEKNISEALVYAEVKSRPIKIKYTSADTEYTTVETFPLKKMGDEFQYLGY